MGVREVIVSPFPPGSGRKMDYTFPDWNANNNGGLTTAIRDRPGVQAANPTGTISGGATGTANVGVVNGVSCVRLINGANLGGGDVIVCDGAGRIHVATLSANVKFSNVTDDYAVTRVYMLARVTATPADATDCGLEIIVGNSSAGNVLFGAKPGWAFQFDNTGGCSLVQKGNSLAVTSTLLQSAAQGFVNTQFHMFEFRFINANSSTNGAFKVYLDGILKVTRAYGSVADDLPLPTTAGGNNNNGYVVNAQTQSRNSELDVALIRVQRAPTEAALF